MRLLPFSNSLFPPHGKALEGATPGFPVKLDGVGELHAAFLNESRIRGCWWSLVQEIRIRGTKTMGAAQRSLSLHRLDGLKSPQGAVQLLNVLECWQR